MERDDPLPLFATAAKGTEGALRDELRELRVRGVRATRGGVGFRGDRVEAMRVCIHSRVAIRVLEWRGRFPARDGEQLYAGTRALQWADDVGPRQTIAVRATCRSSKLTHSQYVAQRTKDAIVDQLRERTGARPNVSRSDPDVLVAVRIAGDMADVYLDVGGASLHRRGWRTKIGDAPLKETLAAAMLRLGGWDRAVPLVDPMCGSGTIAIEAAAWSQGVAPGAARPLGIERWKSFDAELRRCLADLRDGARDAAEAGRSGEVVPVFASDVDGEVLEAARSNARAARVRLQIEKADVRAITPLEPAGFVLTNPPYDARLPATPSLYREMAKALWKLRDHTIVLLAGSDALEHSIRRKPEKWWSVHNGAIPCRLLRYRVR